MHTCIPPYPICRFFPLYRERESYIMLFICLFIYYLFIYLCMYVFSIYVFMYPFIHLVSYLFIILLLYFCCIITMCVYMCVCVPMFGHVSLAFLIPTYPKKPFRPAARSQMPSKLVPDSDWFRFPSHETPQKKNEPITFLLLKTLW